MCAVNYKNLLFFIAFKMLAAQKAEAHRPRGISTQAYASFRKQGNLFQGKPTSTLEKISQFYLMTTLQVDILNPKAGKFLEDLADLNLISIRNTSDDGFVKLINKLRAKALKNLPTLQDITKEVEIVRAKRYAKAKRQGYY